METIRAAVLRHNKDKCWLSQPEWKFLVHDLTKDGIAPNQKRVKAIPEVEPPQKVGVGIVIYI